MCGKEHISTLVVLALCVVISSHASSAAEESPSVSPARFVEGKKSLQSLIDFPNVDDDQMVVLPCFANVSTHGRMSDITCSYQEETDRVFSKPVERPARKARLSSAILNGNKRKVRLQFTAIFLRNAENEEIRILNNVRNNVDKYGLEYIGAQRVDSREFPDNCSMNRDWFVLVRITVAADGSPQNFELDPSSRNIPSGCLDTIKSRMLTSKYIAALSGRTC